MTVTKAEQKQATMRQILDIARASFTESGFAGVNLDRLAVSAGVTKGAIYHHFKSKDGLFLAVFNEIQMEIAARIIQADKRSVDPWEGLRLGCRAFMAAACEPSVQRVVLQDAPSVLGFEAWRNGDEEHSTHLLRERLHVLAKEQRLLSVDPDVLASMISGALNDAAIFIATSQNPKTALKKAGDVFDRMLAGFQSKP